MSSCLRWFLWQNRPHPSVKKRAAWVSQAQLSPPTAHGCSLIAHSGSRWVCSVYQLQTSPSRCFGCFWTSLNYLPCIKVKGFRSRRRNNCCYLPFLVPQVGVCLRLQWGRIVLQDICGSLHRTASSKTQSACESVNFHLSFYSVEASLPCWKSLQVFLFFFPQRTTDLKRGGNWLAR